ncbi:MAG: DNA adenine methylase [Chloroflexi bacterium]|nr:MAG: DNA adenine methylase [Chloroflexota bacterium]
MKQPPLPGFVPPDKKIVNVASVKHRSPFRYPGGKTWLVPRIRQWLQSLPPNKRRIFIEPFAGGAIVGLTVAFEQLAEQVILIELDKQVAAVWQTIINTEDGEWLAQRIQSFEMTPENVEMLLAQKNTTLHERAFQTIVRNRINRGGILAPGAGKMKHGEAGKGLASRWYPNTLSRRILDIVSIRERLRFIQGNALEIIPQYAQEADAVFFIDPPYTAAGKNPGHRLYTHSELDHEHLFSLMAEVKGHFLMTYHDEQQVRNLAAKFRFETRTIAMKNTHHAEQTELLIARNFDWL